VTDNASIRAYYEQQPYPNGVFQFTHPAHVGALAKLYGHLGTPDPATARILDVGCGQGANLLRIAGDLPGADCLGLDLAGVHINEANRQAADAGLKNVRFVRADILEHDFSGQCFDYIIAHGFFAWVPDEVRERLLSLCRDHLTQNGVAVLSYNCLPGWSTRAGLRLLMQMENEALGNSGQELLHGAKRVREFFSKTMPAVAQLPHARLLESEIENLRRKEPDIVLHDELEPLNEPLYLLQFAQWAQSHDLAYVGDTSLLADWLEIYPREIKQALAEYRMSRMQGLQYVDFLMNRDFRRSIICPARAGVHISGRPTPQSLHGLCVASRLRAEPAGKRDDSISYRFIAENAPPGASESIQQPHSELLQIRDPLLRACLDKLAETLGQFQPIDNVIADSCHQTGTTANHDEVWTRLGGFILNMVAQGYLRVSLGVDGITR
jgi:SAM-dependent methyltransferase